MSAGIKTVMLAATAVVSLGLAYWTAPGSIDLELFNDEGELFFPDFKSPDAVTEFEVLAFNEATATSSTFLVRRGADGVWVIPSHHDYPADASERVGTAAALAIGLRKTAIRSDLATDHVELGVLEPLGGDDAGTEGRGTRVTFKGEGGQVLASLIIGKEVEGKDGLRFVRLPNSTRTYEAAIEEMPETRFSKWIERDLLQLSAWDVNRLNYDNYKVEEVLRETVLGPQPVRRLVEGEKLQFVKEDSNWTLADLDDSEEVVNETVAAVATELDDIQIVGVRPKPDGLTARLEKAEGYELEVLADSLQRKGYFLVSNGSIVSNEGELAAHTAKGVKYLLRFGEVLYGDEEAVSASAEASAEGSGAEAEASGQANRYLMVTAELDASAFKKPAEEALEQAELEKRRQARQDIARITSAIATFKARNDNALPETLGALREGEDPVLDKEVAVQDPWEQPYAYERLEGEGEFRVASLGADSAQGGEGAAADIQSDALDREDALAAVASEWKRYREDLDKAKEQVAKLTQRFGPWYYVIAAKSYDTIKLDRAKAVAPKKPAAPEGGGATGG